MTLPPIYYGLEAGRRLEPPVVIHVVLCGYCVGELPHHGNIRKPGKVGCLLCVMDLNECIY